MHSKIPQFSCNPPARAQHRKRRQARCAFRISAALGVCVTFAATITVNGRDILRPGSGAVPSAHAVATGSTGGGAVATQARANALDAMARTTRAIQSVQAMQSAARAAAVAGPNNLGTNPNNTSQMLPNVPNGLVSGGLEVATGATAGSQLWQGAKLPTQSTAGGKSNVNITQTSQQAVLNWKSFNVGKDTTLNFDQSAGGANKSQWVAFNKVSDPSGVPSQILGSMKADGQIYVINQNGIIFGGSSQVNARALVASSLAINDNLVKQGLLNNRDSQFLFSSLPLPGGANGTPAFTPDPPPAGKTGDVTVKAGAQLTTTQGNDGGGGRVMLVGPNVKNDGTISTPSGQTILAAGNQVGVAAHPSSDPSLRGLDAYVGAVDVDSGSATNSGMIDAPKASVTITGKRVNQLGVIRSTTSVDLNGRVDLLADYNSVSNTETNFNNSRSTGGVRALSPYLFLPKSSGIVTLGEGSVTQILPEYSNDSRVVGTQLALPSQVNMQGRAVHLTGDATVLAPNANVNVSAGEWSLYNPGGNQYARFNYTAGQIYMDSGATINVAGSVDISAPMSENIIDVQLRGSELKDSPLQRDGALRGQTITVDIRQTGVFNGITWVGTPVGDVSGYSGLVKRTAGELTIAGGNVTMSAGESVVMQPGSKVDVSGGWINYQGGVVQTSRVYSGRNIYDISKATPDIAYDGIYTGQFTQTFAKWSVTKTYLNALALTGRHYEQGYTYGGNGGAVSIAAPSMALDGTLLGLTVTGPRQRDITPGASALSLAFQAQDAFSSADPTPYFSPTPPAIIFDPSRTLVSADSFALDSSGVPTALRKERKDEVVLTPALTSTNGFGKLSITNTDGDITVPAGVTLATTPGGAVTLKAGNLAVFGAIVSPAGSIGIEVWNITASQLNALQVDPSAVTPPANPGRGAFTLGSAALLSTAGSVVDDRFEFNGEQTRPLLTRGGTIGINSFSAAMAAGSAVDVSGGVAMSAAGKASYGKGGSISVKTGQDLNIGSVLGGSVAIGSNFLGYSGTEGGSLSIGAPLIQVGGAATHGNTVLLQPEFFRQGGFTKFSLTGLGATTSTPGEYIPGVLVAANTVVNPVAERWVAVPYTPGQNGVTLKTVLPDAGSRKPVSLSISSSGVTDKFNNTILLARGDTVLADGSLIQTDAGGSVSISGNTSTVLGSIVAPGGSISVTGKNNTALLLLVPSGEVLPNVNLGSQSVLSTAGTTVLTPDPRNYRSGSVLAGGTITVSGNIVAESGARLDVSGASGVLDLAPTASSVTAKFLGSFRGSVRVPTVVESGGGTIHLTGDQALFTDATLVGAAGGSSAKGGTVIVESGRYVPIGGFTTPLDTNLTITQNGPAIPAPFYTAGQTAIGRLVVDKNGTPLPGQGYLTADALNQGGFDDIVLKGTVKFSGPVSIAASHSITAGTGGVLYGNSTVNLSAPYVAVGSAFETPKAPGQVVNAFTAGGSPFYFSPTHGTGKLTISGSLIDVGNLSLQGFGSANLVAANGDIRGNGTLDVAGNIRLTAGQIYPPTAVTFTIASYDYTDGSGAHPGTVTILGSGSRSLPLSAGGQLNIYGSVITQGGVLRAPFGSINIGWDGVGNAPVDLIAGSTVGIALTTQVTLRPGSIASVSGVDPSTGQGISVPYGINLNGTSWIDPAGTDITLIGPPAKSIAISGSSVISQAGSTIDLRGGGNLYAYRWVKGLGGSSDILSSTTSFAVIPGYSAGYAPFAPYNSSPLTTNLGTDPGYTNSTLNVGDSLYLGGGSGLPAGTYTLLPARYALLEGAFLVTPKTGTAVGTVSTAEGASLVSGYRYNSMRATPASQPPVQRFEVASSTILAGRAEYTAYSANTFFPERAAANNFGSPRLPADAGSLALSASQAMGLRGSVLAGSPSGRRGGSVDISSPVDILIAGPNASASPGTLVLDSSLLSTFGAQSLLIGGVRQVGANGTSVTVKTSDVKVDNAGTPLTGNEIIIVAKNSLTVAEDAVISSTGAASASSEPLLLGGGAAGSGNGTLLRVSNDSAAKVSRTGVDTSTQPLMTIGSGAKISGAGVILDSTYASDFSPNAVFTGRSLSLGSGQISLLLDNPGALQTSNGGLVLSGAALTGLQSAQTLSFLSYSSLDVYGTGGIGSAASSRIELHAGEIRGFNQGVPGSAAFTAKTILLDNAANATSPGAIAVPAGALALNAQTLTFGEGRVAFDQFATVVLNASSAIASSTSGILAAQGALEITTPAFVGAAGTSRTITSGGSLAMLASAASAPTGITSGLGSSLTMQGASVQAESNIALPSGVLSLTATAGDLNVGGRLDVAGVARQFFDFTRYTSGGRITLSSVTGSVNVLSGAAISVGADAAAGDAGTLAVSVPQGTFTVQGSLAGNGGAGGKGGTFSLDVGSIPNSGTPSLKPVNDALNAGGFTTARAFRVRTGDAVLDGLATAHSFSLSADQGSIAVAGSGKIDASGATGGTISLIANGGVLISTGAVLTVAAQNFDAAGKGGAISIESGASRNGSNMTVAFGTGPQLEIQTGSEIDLTVANATTAAADAALGHFTGTLHLRAPQAMGNSEVQIQPVAGTVSGASLITVEGFQVFNLLQGGTITSSGSNVAGGGNITSGRNVQGSVNANGVLFGGNSVAIANRILPGNSAVVVMPGAEIINLTGNLTLGTASSTASADWNLATFRYGTNSAPGILTLRAAQDIVFFNAISDGFTTSAYNALLLTQSSTLPLNAQSWSYRFTAGADFSAADFTRVLPLAQLVNSSSTPVGSLLLGKNYGLNVFTTGTNASTSTIIPSRFQVIRTGSGDITISAGRDVRLLNQFATIYTAGTQVADATMGGTFALPNLSATGANAILGAVQENTPYASQYSLAGGNVSIAAQNDIAHKTVVSGTLIDDSSRELPINWLYRRGYVNPATGEFGTGRFGDVSSTTWWTDFSNFFEGVGTLGGGNLTMAAGHDVSNVDGVVATNARMPGSVPNASKLLELGGGNLTARAGNDISGGVYYVERGRGVLAAGNEIRTNSTRSPSRGNLVTPADILAPETWLPTTLFLGKGSFDITAQGNVLLGPVANAFLLPQGYSNSFWNKTYFSTYAETDAVNVNSLGGSVSIRTEASLTNQSAQMPLLQAWLQNISLLDIVGGNASASASFYQPWLRLNESSLAPFASLVSLMPPTLKATAFTGDINLAGDITLSPSATGTLELAAGGSINGLQPLGPYTLLNANGKSWGASVINVSDADPSRIPGIASPYAFRSTLAANRLNNASANANTSLLFLAGIDQLFAETGSTTGSAAVLQTQQALHAAGVLHASDTSPVRIYGSDGSISGITLFSGKAARIVAGEDLTDFALYIQNARSDDVTLVAAGNDIIAYNPNSPLRSMGSSGGNFLLQSNPLAGDIQLGGPGTLEVFAGRNLTTGIGATNADGTALGITTIGNARNPFLSEDGAAIIAGAGVRLTGGLAGDGLGFGNFIGQFLNPASAGTQSARYLPELATLMGIAGASEGDTWTAFGKLSDEKQRQFALGVFYLVLRDSGRDYNDPDSANYKTYTAGFSAISALFSGKAWSGDINLTSREVKTFRGGGIQLFAPGGKLTVGIDIAGTQPLDQGILTEKGGSISIFTNGNVDVGTSRIFTLRGGDEIIWSSTGDIAAGSSSKTVQSAPPTRVLIDPQSGSVKTDLAGLATGGGIGVLASVAGIEPGSVDLVAPGGAIDAGDAGIRSTGKLNVAATVILNASNIAASGGSTGTPTVSVAAPNISAIAATSSTAAAAGSAASEAAKQTATQSAAPAPEEPPSLYTVEVLGYGGGEG